MAALCIQIETSPNIRPIKLLSRGCGSIGPFPNHMHGRGAGALGGLA